MGMKKKNANVEKTMFLRDVKGEREGNRAALSHEL